MTRRAVPFCAGWAAALFLSFYVGGPVLPAVATAVGLAAIVFRPAFKNRLLLFIAAFLLAFSWREIFYLSRIAPLERLDGEEARVVGTVEDYSGGDRSSVTVKGTVNGIPARAIIYLSGFEGRLGDKIELTARMSAFKDTAFFRAREYYLPDGIFISGSAGGAKIIGENRTFFTALKEYSKKVSQNIRRSVPGESGELLAAMVTGDRSAFSSPLRLMLNRAGIGHLAAVSGLHVSAVIVLAAAILKRLRAPRVLSAAVCIFCAGAYIVFAGLRVSAIRAGIMLLIAILSSFVRRRSDPLNTICVCGFLMTIINPCAAADSSLTLSLAGVFGVAVMSPAVCREFGIKSRILKTVVASVCAAFATSPFIMLYFNELSLLSPITNIFAIPLCSAALFAGMLYALFGCAFSPIINLAGVICKIAVLAAEKISSLGVGVIPLGYRAASIAAFAGVCSVIALWLCSKNIRKTALFGAFCSAAVAAAFCAEILISGGSLSVCALSRGDLRAAVLRKGAECIIIDLDGGMADGVETAVERYGISKISAAIALDNAESAYSAYCGLSVPPDKILLPPGSYVYGGRVKTGIFSKGSAISAFGAKITVGEDEIKIISQSGAEYSLYIKNGLCVFGKAGKTEVFKGDLIKQFGLE